ncbi:hypothetical protein K505DRAFT_87185 [Melanomma pulvis-pyrius CBS 109.77]|uniref:Uncharacterized protein n=1 Tax=Melanomma pulvis-pyrius CBS 109.77 TaxID=1314802 RepID=A0A6A6XR40_9PLEO|nr:hypothetical protein K505DRAFT_87185 [Melanomma pulvis-pyrius CBS 109.77]
MPGACLLLLLLPTVPLLALTLERTDQESRAELLPPDRIVYPPLKSFLTTRCKAHSVEFPKVRKNAQDNLESRADCDSKSCPKIFKKQDQFSDTSSTFPCDVHVHIKRPRFYFRPHDPVSPCKASSDFHEYVVK